MAGQQWYGIQLLALAGWGDRGQRRVRTEMPGSCGGEHTEQQQECGGVWKCHGRGVLGASSRTRWDDSGGMTANPEDIDRWIWYSKDQIIDRCLCKLNQWLALIWDAREEREEAKFKIHTLYSSIAIERGKII